MSFFDYVLAGFGIHEAQDYNDKPIIRNQIKQKNTTPIKHIPQQISDNKKLAIFCPTNMQEVIEVVEFISTQQPTMLNLSMMDKNLLQRSMDFIQGAKTAMQSSMECVGDGLYIFAPKGTKMINRMKTYE